jgi:IS5 family transposase
LDYIERDTSGVAKTHAQMVMAAISENLLKAANKITLNKQTPAIA